MELVKAFNSELAGLYECRPPISKAKMTAITKAAIRAIKFYKHVVQGVEKFIQKCKTEYKVPGLYVIDSIVRQSRHQYGIEKDVFAPRFSKNIKITFFYLFKCSPEDKSKIIRVLNLWQKNHVFGEEVIQPLFDLANPSHTVFKEVAAQIAIKASKAKTHHHLQDSDLKSKSHLQAQDQENIATTPVSLASQHSLGVTDMLVNPAHAGDADFRTASALSPRVLNNQTHGNAITSTPSTVTSLDAGLLQQIQQILMKQPPVTEEISLVNSHPPVSIQSSITEGAAIPVIGMAQPEPIKVSPKFSPFHMGAGDFDGRSLPFLDTSQPPPGYIPPGTFVHPSVPPLGVPPPGLDFSQHHVPKSPLEEGEHSDESEEIKERHIDSDVDRYSSLRHSRHRRHRSRSRSKSPRSRSHRSRDRDRRDRDRHHDTDKDKEKRRDREKKGLPLMKTEHLSICSTTLWVGHLPKAVQADELSEIFAEFGEVVSIDLIPPRGCAFICMKRRQDAARALSKLKRHKIQNKEITLAWATGKSLKGKEFKDFWDVDVGCTYIPYSKLSEFPHLQLEMFEDGGMVDETTIPDWLSSKLQLPSGKNTDKASPPVGIPNYMTLQVPQVVDKKLIKGPPMIPGNPPPGMPPTILPPPFTLATMSSGMPSIAGGIIPPTLPPLGVPPPLGMPPINMPPVSTILGQPLIGTIPQPSATIGPSISAPPPTLIPASNIDLASLGNNPLTAMALANMSNSHDSDSMDVEMEDAEKIDSHNRENSTENDFRFFQRHSGNFPNNQTVPEFGNNNDPPHFEGGGMFDRDLRFHDRDFREEGVFRGFRGEPNFFPNSAHLDAIPNGLPFGFRPAFAPHGAPIGIPRGTRPDGFGPPVAVRMMGGAGFGIRGPHTFNPPPGLLPPPIGPGAIIGNRPPPPMGPRPGQWMDRDHASSFVANDRSSEDRGSSDWSKEDSKKTAQDLIEDSGSKKSRNEKERSNSRSPDRFKRDDMRSDSFRRDDHPRYDRFRDDDRYRDRHWDRRERDYRDRRGGERYRNYREKDYERKDRDRDRDREKERDKDPPRTRDRSERSRPSKWGSWDDNAREAALANAEPSSWDAWAALSEKESMPLEPVNKKNEEEKDPPAHEKIDNAPSSEETVPDPCNISFSSNKEEVIITRESDNKSVIEVSDESITEPEPSDEVIETNEEKLEISCTQENNTKEEEEEDLTVMTSTNDGDASASNVRLFRQPIGFSFNKNVNSTLKEPLDLFGDLPEPKGLTSLSKLKDKTELVVENDSKNALQNTEDSVVDESTKDSNSEFNSVPSQLSTSDLINRNHSSATLSVCNNGASVQTTNASIDSSFAEQTVQLECTNCEEINVNKSPSFVSEDDEDKLNCEEPADNEQTIPKEE